MRPLFLDHLSEYDLVYMGSPYTKYPRGIEAAFQDAAKIACRLMQAGIKVYSPIAHTHPLAIYGGADPLDHAIWLPFDQAIMSKSDAMVVAKMEGWDTSYGVAHEIAEFKKAGKAVFYLDPETMELEGSDDGW